MQAYAGVAFQQMISHKTVLFSISSEVDRERGGGGGGGWFAGFLPGFGIYMMYVSSRSQPHRFGTPRKYHVTVDALVRQCLMSIQYSFVNIIFNYRLDVQTCNTQTLFQVNTWPNDSISTATLRGYLEHAHEFALMYDPLLGYLVQRVLRAWGWVISVARNGITSYKIGYMRASLLSVKLSVHSKLRWSTQLQRVTQHFCRSTAMQCNTSAQICARHANKFVAQQ